MKKSIIFPGFLFLFIFILNACQQKPKVGWAVIEGTVDHPVKNGYIKLEKLDSGQATTVDSVQLTSGNKFKLEAEAKTPQFFRIDFFNRQRQFMILGAGKVTVNADGRTKNGKFVITGSPATNDLRTVDKWYAGFERERNISMGQFLSARNKKDSVKMHIAQQQYNSLQNAFHQKIKAAVDTMGGRLSALMIATDYLPMEGNETFYSTLLTKLQAANPHSPRVARLQEKYDQLRAVSIGSEAPGLVLPNPNGKMVSLKSFRGKIMLLDFWASWCHPCRAENPNLVKTYNKYHSKGFAVLGVSLDKNKAAWLKAIKDDGLEWPQVSDLQYLDSKAVEVYGIQAIPTNFLIDKNGKIIAKDLFGKALDKKLEEVLG